MYISQVINNHIIRSLKMDIFELLEDFRLYLVSFWPDYYKLTHSFSNRNLFDQYFVKMWNYFWELPLFSQIIVSVLSIFVASTFLTKVYTNLTKGTCKSKARLDGETVLITGANSGIGYETALDLAARGARIVMGCRNVDRGVEAAQKIMAETGNRNLLVKKLDLSCMATVRQFAREFLASETRLDILVLNAGLALTKKYLTEDGLELHMAANHFGHFLLGNLVTPLMVETAKLRKRPGRIVAVSSVAHKWGKIELDNLNSEKYYDANRIYGTTKLANILFINELARRLKGANVNANSVHPGAVQTSLFRNIAFFGPIIHFCMGLACKTAKEGAQTSIYAAVDEALDGVSGKYLADCQITQPSNDATDAKLALDFWKRSVQVLEMEYDEEFGALEANQ